MLSGIIERDLGRRVAAESLGTALLLAAIVGSGIMGDRLARGNLAVELLAVSIATGAMLYVVVLVFGPISGAHFNPAVTICDALRSGLRWGDVAPYVVAQCLGAFAGVAIANVMFGDPVFFASAQARTGVGLWVGEFIATFGLLATIWGCTRYRSTSTPMAVGAYITAALWFTSSTAFANPAVTLARTVTDTFAGIRAADAPAFIVAQLLGAVAATALFAWLAPSPPMPTKKPMRSAIS